jgi:hypothetical protein
VGLARGAGRLTVRTAGRRWWTAASGLLVAAAVVIGGGTARAAATATTPFSGPASATLSQSPGSPGDWQTSIDLDTAALCPGTLRPDSFTLVTSGPEAMVSPVAASYTPAGPTGPACGNLDANPVTTLTLTFRPALAGQTVPQSAALVITPPHMRVKAGETPYRVQLTLQRVVSPWLYAGIPLLCGLGAAVLFVLLLILVGLPPAAPLPAPAGRPELADRPAQAALKRGRTRWGKASQVVSALLLALVGIRLLAVAVRREPGAADAVERPGGAARAPEPDAGPASGPRSRQHEPDAGRPPQPDAGRRKRRRHGRIWGAPLYASSSWSFSGSWATSITPLTTLASGVLISTNAVAGLIRGVDLTRFTLLITLFGALAVLAPLLFGLLNGLWPGRAAPLPGEVDVARLWVLVTASCLTVFAVGAELGFLGWVLGFDLLDAGLPLRWIAPGIAALTAVVFLGYSVSAVCALAPPADSAKHPAFTARTKQAKFLI